MFPVGLFFRWTLRRKKAPTFAGPFICCKEHQHNWIAQSNRCPILLHALSDRSIRIGRTHDWIGLHNPNELFAQAFGVQISINAVYTGIPERHTLRLLFQPGGSEPLAEFAGLGLEFGVGLQLLFELHFLLHEFFIGHGSQGGGACQR